MNQQKEFAEQQWEPMREAMEKGGPAGVKAFIEGFSDPSERRQLYYFGHRAFSGRDWQGKDLDQVADFTELGIDELLEHSQAEADAEKAKAYKNAGNAMSFNLAADLADCWPGDDVPREHRHFERGLAAAERCIRWREELQAKPEHFSIAWWAKGMHELSLGRHAESLRSFVESRDFAVKSAEAEGHDTSISPDGHWSVLLAAGYVGIAQCAGGDEQGRAALQQCYAALTEGMKQQPDQAGDLQFCLDQLQKVEGKYLTD
jgi:hypothetical protein